MFRTNLSEFAKQVAVVGKRTIFQEAGNALRDAVMEDFDTLLLETPQWDGTTVASYNIGFYPVSEEVREQPMLEREDALQKGHLSAVNVARSANANAIPDGFEGWRRSDLLIVNEAPGFETAEEGPVRPVNSPAGALARFMDRFEDRIIDVDFGDL